VEIEGKIMIARFLGTATRHVGKDVFSHAISLRRKLPSGTPLRSVVLLRARAKHLVKIATDAAEGARDSHVISSQSCIGLRDRAL
jgi:hypothetical protein